MRRHRLLTLKAETTFLSLAFFWYCLGTAYGRLACSAPQPSSPTCRLSALRLLSSQCCYQTAQLFRQVSSVSPLLLPRSQFHLSCSLSPVSLAPTGTFVATLLWPQPTNPTIFPLFVSACPALLTLGSDCSEPSFACRVPVLLLRHTLSSPFGCSL